MKTAPMLITARNIATLAVSMSFLSPSDCRAEFSAGDVALGAGQDLFVGSAMIGWSFTADLDITVIKLGYFDYGGDGFGEAHQVGIWNQGGQLLGSAVVQSSDALSNGFRYASTSGLSLSAGQSYVIAGFQSNEFDPFAIDGAASGGIVTNPAITFSGTRVSFASSFSQPIPGSGGVSSTAIGPNFVFTETVAISPVPEPGTALFGLALIGASMMHRRRSRSA
jgi:Domain of unknown function (DUF4082)/PEP-CTERM motif